MEFELTHHHGFIEATTSGIADRATFEKLMDAMVAHPQWKPGTPWLHDHSLLNAAQLTVEDVRAIAQFCADRRHLLGRSRAAIIVARDLEYGLGRMWAVFVEDRWDVVGNIFRRRDEGVAWLGQEASA